MSAALLNQIGLAFAFFGAVFLAFSRKVGVIGRDGSMIVEGLDPRGDAAENQRKIESSHWRNRYFTPIGWGMLTFGFLLQFVATLR